MLESVPDPIAVRDLSSQEQHQNLDRTGATHAFQELRDMGIYGALVGWVHHEAGDRILLRMESVQSTEAAARHDPDVFRFLMTKQQAAVLGNYLMRLSGQTKASDRGTWFRRWFG